MYSRIGEQHATRQQLPTTLEVESPSSAATTSATPRSRLQAWAPLLLLSAGLVLGLVASSSGRESSIANPPVEGADATGPPHVGDFCRATDRYTKETVKSLLDAPVASLLQHRDLRGQRKFEASDVMVLGDHYYAICDSSWAILRVHQSLPTLSPLNSHVGDPAEGYSTGESGFEALFFDHPSSSFFLVRESVDISGDPRHAHLLDDDDRQGARRQLGLDPVTDDPRYHAIILQVAFPWDHPGFLPPLLPLGTQPDGPSHSQQALWTNYTVLQECPSEFEFEGDSKGFEGASSLRGRDGTLYVLGLCEGNHCKEGDRGKERGNGRVVVMTRHVDDDGTCVWRTVNILHLPPHVMFQDYSALSLHQNTRTAVITSQENGQVWVTQLEGGKDFEFDPFSASFAEGKIYDFPRGDSCEQQYCNVEGISFVNSVSGDAPPVLVAVSDKMKSRGRQPFTCLQKDQSFHLFALP